MRGLHQSHMALVCINETMFVLFLTMRLVTMFYRIALNYLQAPGYI